MSLSVPHGQQSRSVQANERPEELSATRREEGPGHQRDYQALMKEAAKELAQGSLHPELMVRKRIVDPNSPPGQAFDLILHDLYDRLIQASRPPFLLTPKPSTFLLRDEGSYNAGYLPSSHKFFTFNRGLGVGENRVGSLDVFVSILAHELTHREYRDRHGITGNSSKHEEAFADLAPLLTVLHEAGFNPRAAMHAMVDRAKYWKELAPEERLSHLVDEHPTDRTRALLYKAALAYLELKRGDFSEETTPLNEAKVTVNGELITLSDVFESGVHHSPIAEALSQHGWKVATSEREKAACILAVLQKIPLLDPVRAEDLSEALKQIRLSSSDQEDLLLGDELANAIYSMAERGFTIGARHLYQTLESKTFQDSGITLGRLRPIAECGERFIKAKNTEEILHEAGRFIELLQAEPLAHIFRDTVKKIEDTERTHEIDRHSFLSVVHFPDFASPRNNKSSPLAHQPHLEAARKCGGPQADGVIAALLALGIEDYRSFPSMSGELGAKYLVRDVLIVRTPKLFFHDAIIDEAGYLLPPLKGSERRARDLPHPRQIALQELIEKSVKTLEKTPGSESTAEIGPTPVLGEQVVKSNFLLLLGGFSSKSLIASGLLKTSPAFVARLNAQRIVEFTECQTKLVHELQALENEGNIAAVTAFCKELVIQLENQSKYTSREFIPFKHLKRNGIFGYQPLLEYVYQGRDSFGSDQLFLNTMYWLSAPRSLCASRVSEHTRQEVIEIALLPIAARIIGKSVKMPKSWDDFLSLKDSLAEKKLSHEGEIALLGPISTALILQKVPVPLALYERVHKWSRLLTDSGIMPSDRIVEQTKRFLEKQAPVNTEEPVIAAEEWAIIYRNRLIPRERAHERLRGLLKTLSTAPETPQREALREILSAGTIRDQALRKQVATHYAESLKREYGEDDTSSKYYHRIKKEIELLRQVTNAETQPLLFDTVAQTLIAQRKLAYTFREGLEPLSENLRNQNELVGILVEGGLETLSKNSESRKAIVKFLLSNGEGEDVDYLIEDLEYWTSELSQLRARHELTFEFKGKKNPKFTAVVNQSGRQELERWRETYRTLYRSFWESPLGVRAALCAELFFPEGQTTPAEYEKAFQEIVHDAVPAGKPHAGEIREWVTAYIKGKDQFKQPFYLSALLTAVDRTNRSNEKFGNTLALLAELMGPAELKCAQAAEGHPGIDEDIQPDPERVKMKADMPTRWELFEMIDRQLLPEEREKFPFIGTLEGGGSIYVSVRAKSSGGEDGVLSVERPFTPARAESGFRSLEKMIDNRFGENSTRARLGKEILREGRELLADELQTDRLPQKVSALKSSYSRIEVQVDEDRHTFQFVNLLDHGKHFRFTEYADGKPLLHALQGKDTEKSEQRSVAMAGVAAELTLILSGEIFDTDAHGGNGKVVNKGPNDRVTKRFDPGGALLRNPTTEELVQLGEFLFSVLQRAKSPKEILPVINAALTEKYETEEALPFFLRKVQKAITALGGHIRVLSPGDFLTAVTAALPHAHQTLKALAVSKVMSGQANQGLLKDMIPRLMSGAASSGVKVTLRP